jgi:hypothetical protein
MKNLLLLILSCCSLYLHAQKNPCNTDGKPYSQLPGDTTITLPSGTTITFNRCEFFDIRDCIQIVEITDPEQLQREGANMYDDRGNILISCGMIKFDMKDCGKKCFEVPIKIKIRVRFPDCRNEPNAIPNLYFNSGAGWTQPKSVDYRVTTYNDIRYIELNTPCPVKLINCDIPKKGRKIKFVAPKGNKIVSMRTGITCPVFYSDDRLDIPKRKFKIRLLCVNTQRVMIQSAQVKENGDSLVTAQTSLATLKHGRRQVNCSERKRSFLGRMFGWVKPVRGGFYRKYYLPSK